MMTAVTTSVVERFLHPVKNNYYLSLLSLRNKRVNPDFFKKCGNTGTNVRPCVLNNQIPSHDDTLIYVFRNEVSRVENKKAQPYVSEAYAKEWIFDNDRIKTFRMEQKKMKQRNSNQVRVERKSFDPNDIQPLPDMIELPNDIGFTDQHGDKVPIEMRGTLSCEGVLFNAIDLEKAFATKKLYDRVTESKGSFEYGKHYRFYSGPRINSALQKSKNTVSDKHLYLTYMGVVKYLFCTRSGNLEHFQKWAINILFTHQFGSQDAKDALAGELVGVKHKTIKTVFRYSHNKIPCVYLIRIGTVDAIRAHFQDRQGGPNLDGLPDHVTIYKYGETKHLDVRYDQHVKTYGTWASTFGCEKYLNIDPAFVCKAEAHLSRFFDLCGMRLNDAKHTELVAIPSERMAEVNQCFNDMSVLFTRESDDLKRQKEALEASHSNELMQLRHEITTLKHTHTNEMMRLKHDFELLQRDNENALLRMRLEAAEKMPLECSSGDTN
jgi:hypothetical protein